MVTAERRDGRSSCPSVSASLARHVSPYRLARRSRRSASAVLNRPPEATVVVGDPRDPARPSGRDFRQDRLGLLANHSCCKGAGLSISYPLPPDKVLMGVLPTRIFPRAASTIGPGHPKNSLKRTDLSLESSGIDTCETFGSIPDTGIAAMRATRTGGGTSNYQKGCACALTPDRHHSHCPDGGFDLRLRETAPGGGLAYPTPVWDEARGGPPIRR